MAATAITLGTVAYASSADAASKLRLVSSSDYSLPCAWGRDGSIRTTERVDAVVMSYGLPVWIADDGTQFIADHSAGGKFWSCRPGLGSVPIPAAWVRD